MEINLSFPVLLIHTSLSTSPTATQNQSGQWQRHVFAMAVYCLLNAWEITRQPSINTNENSIHITPWSG